MCAYARHLVHVNQLTLTVKLLRAGSKGMNELSRKEFDGCEELEVTPNPA